jgi:hypothetical protein
MKNSYTTTIFFLFFLFFLCTKSLAQQIVYTYDSSGNRISRQYVVQLRSATAKATTPEDTLSVEADTEGLQVIVYPNPTRGDLQVKVSGIDQDADIQLFLCTLQGSPIQKVNTQYGITTINMSGYASGCYLLRVNAKGKRLEFKIIKQ